MYISTNVNLMTIGKGKEFLGNSRGQSHVVCAWHLAAKRAQTSLTALGTWCKLYRTSRERIRGSLRVASIVIKTTWSDPVSGAIASPSLTCLRLARTQSLFCEPNTSLLTSFTRKVSCLFFSAYVLRVQLVKPSYWLIHVYVFYWIIRPTQNAYANVSRLSFLTLKSYVLRAALQQAILFLHIWSTRENLNFIASCMKF